MTLHFSTGPSKLFKFPKIVRRLRPWLSDDRLAWWAGEDGEEKKEKKQFLNLFFDLPQFSPLQRRDTKIYVDRAWGIWVAAHAKMEILERN